MAEHANSKSSAVLFGLPVGDLIDLAKHFTLNLITVGVIVGGFYFAITQPDKWLQRFNEGRNEQQKNYLESQNAQATMQAAVEKEREVIRANAAKEVANALKEMSEGQKEMAAAVREQTRIVTGRTYSTPKKTEAAKSADAKGPTE